MEFCPFYLGVRDYFAISAIIVAYPLLSSIKKPESGKVDTR